MNELRLAQFSQLSNCKQRLDFLKKVDVNYCLQDEPHQSGLTKDRFGRTYLYVAVSKSCYCSVNELLSLGVDLFKQTSNYLGPEEMMTPLCLAIQYIDSKCIWTKRGILKNKMANLLLSAQIKTGNTVNPEDKNGITHFHIACIVNHLEAIKFFLDAGKPINQVCNSDSWRLPGYTALHCAIKYSSVEAAKILVDYGADIHLKDAKDTSSLHLLMERLMDLTDYVNMGKRACCLILKEEIERMQLIISHILKNPKAKEGNFADDTGLTAFHMACALSEMSVVENFLQQNVDINASINSDSDFWPGYTPMHFAACFNVEIVKLLLQRGSIITKNADGKTALDLCMEKFSPKVIHSILSCKSELKNILFSDGSTSLLDALLLMDDCDKFNNFLQSSSDVNICISHDSPLWPGNTLLHLSILMNEKTKNLKDFYDKTFFEENTEASDKTYNCSESEELGYWKRIVVCLVRGCSLSAKNADGLTPIHLAFKLHKANIVDKLLNTCKSDAADPSNLTHFHIACAAGKKSLIELFLSQRLDVNCTVKRSFTWCRKLRKFEIEPKVILAQADSTPLHLAVIFGQIEIVELLLQNGANVYAAQDALGQTPIHLSSLRFYSDKSMAQMLLNKTPNLKEVVSKQGFTHLHVAAYADNGKAVDELLEVGSDVDAVFQYKALEEKNKDYDLLSDYDKETPLYIAMSGESGDAARALIRGGADISKRIDCDYETSPLIEALDYMCSNSSKCIINKAKREYKESIGPIIESGATMLHVACASFDLKLVKKLLERGADVNARIRDDDDYENHRWSGHTPLLVLITEALEVEKLPKNLIVLAKLLLKHGADVTIRCSCVPSTSLHDVYEKANESKNDEKALFLSMVDLFLNSHKSYDVNPTHFNSGLSHVHIACIRNNIEVVKNFLDSDIDVNHHVDYFDCGDTSGFTPLHFALHYKHGDLAHLLIERGADVTAEAVNGDTPLHVALKKNCADIDIIEMLYRNEADFHAQNLKAVTPMICLLEMENFMLKQLEFFLKRDCKFDVTYYRSSEGIIGLAMKNAESSERKLIFEKIIKTDDVKSAITGGFNAIRSIVMVNHNGRLTLEFYIHAIKLLIGMGCNLDQQNKNGKSLIHNAVYFYNLEGLEALLHLGADLNVVDTKNRSPLSTSVTSDANIKQERKSEVIKTLVSHAYKMMFLGILENSVEKEMFTLGANKSSFGFTVQVMCACEMYKLESTQICDGLSVKSFVSEGFSTYPLMVSSKRKCVDKFFKNSEKVTQLFPEFGGLCNMQYRKAVSKIKQSDLLKK